MNADKLLYEFLDGISSDPYIGPPHISLFVAILRCWEKQDYQMPISVFGKDLRKVAKISGNGLYHKCMSDLKNQGYIGYLPSFNPSLGSLVYLLCE